MNNSMLSRQEKSRLSLPSCSRAGARLGRRTCNRAGMPRGLGPRYEDDVALARIGIVLLQEEELVDSILS